jgi:hypothetical protein
MENCFPSPLEALRALSDQVGDDDVVFLHNHRPGDYEREHLDGAHCWCNPQPLLGRQLRGYYDA